MTQCKNCKAKTTTGARFCSADCIDRYYNQKQPCTKER